MDPELARQHDLIFEADPATLIPLSPGDSAPLYNIFPATSRIGESLKAGLHRAQTLLGQ